MAQVLIYGHTEHLAAIRSTLSDTIHSCIVDALEYPPEKRFQRFIGLEPADFIYSNRSADYTIIEIHMFEGRSVAAKKALIRLLYERAGERCGITANDLEITIIETPRHNWGIRGLPGDEIGLNYRVEV